METQLQRLTTELVTICREQDVTDSDIEPIIERKISLIKSSDRPTTVAVPMAVKRVLFSLTPTL